MEVLVYACPSMKLVYVWAYTAIKAVCVCVCMCVCVETSGPPFHLASHKGCDHYHSKVGKDCVGSHLDGLSAINEECLLNMYSFLPGGTK